MNSPVTFSSFFLLSATLFSTLSATLFSTQNPISASTNCVFPAIFNFGDSNSDTGGLASAFTPPESPYGDTFFGMPAGRYSDGRLIIDFIASSFKVPYLSAYLNSLGTSFRNGANFATAASTVRIPSSIIPAGGFSPFSLQVQYWQFSQFINRSRIIRQKGGLFAELMPREEYFGKGLYTVDIGQNDLGEGFFGNMTVQQVNASVPSIISNFSSNVKSLYELGGRSFWIHNTGPIGCLPYIAAAFPAPEDSAGCAQPYNEVAQYFNSELKQAVAQLRQDFPSAAFTYVDVYSVKYSLFQNPQKYGFELPLAACCGYGGGKYNFRDFAQCGQRVIINGSEVFVGSCDRPEVRVVWDGIHYTEAANKIIFDQISTGSFSDPPVPLSKACRRN